MFQPATEIVGRTSAVASRIVSVASSDQQIIANGTQNTPATSARRYVTERTIFLPSYLLTAFSSAFPFISINSFSSKFFHIIDSTGRSLRLLYLALPLTL